MTRRRVGRLLIFGWCVCIITLGMGEPVRAATITVTNLFDDSWDPSAFPGSLRWAIQEAAPGDTITFDIPDIECPCPIRLSNFELVIDKNLTIRGPGPTLITIYGTSGRVFRIAPGVTAHLEGLQVSGGDLRSYREGANGGGILNEGTLSLSNVVVSDNKAARGGKGGGIHSIGALSIRGSAVLNNTALAGGGIAVFGAALTVRDSTIAGNVVEDAGGGIWTDNFSETVIVGTTIANNVAAEDEGGGLLAYGTATLINSTISGNYSGFQGGGLAKHGEGLTLINTTVTNNTATENGGGVRRASGGSVVLTNTIVTGNLPGDVDASEVTNNNSLIGGVVNDVLFPLADNGGPTQTHKLKPNSDAIGAGNNALLPADALDLDSDGNTTEPLPVDQRGLGFPRVAGFNVDIGAVEAVCTAIVLTRTPPPAPSVSVAYSETIVASGGVGPYSFAATSLPGGLALSTTTGVLSGTPTASGTFTVTVTVTDAYGCGGTLTYTLTIADPSCGIVIEPATLKTPYLATLYYQALSVAPSGQYIVTVSAGALPPGVYLFAIGQNWYIGGIPTKPGEYTFTLAATKTNSPCAPTRTYTVIVPPTVLAQLTCVVKTRPKEYTAWFGYDNSTDGPVSIDVGANNYFTPGSQSRGQVTTFHMGRVTKAFSVVFTVKGNSSDLAIWYLRGPDGVRRPVNITTATSRCP